VEVDEFVIGGPLFGQPRLFFRRIVMLFASLRSMFDTGFMVIVLAKICQRWEAKEFLAKHPETAKQGAQIIGGLILRHLKKW
jgi:hypothetical protein